MLTGKKVVGATGWMFASGYLNLLISFIGNLLLARILIPDDFGVYALASSILAVVFMFAGFGSQEAIIQCRDENIKKLIPTAFWMTVLLGFCLAVIGTISGLLLRERYDTLIIQIIIVLSWLRLLQNIGYAYEAILQRRFKFKENAFVSFTSGFTSFIVAIVVAFLGWGAWALVVREAVLIIFRMVGLGWASKYRIPLAFDRHAAHWIWNFGWRMMLLRVNESLFGRVDNLIVGTAFGTTALGYYSFAYRLTYLGFQLVQGSLKPVLFSTFASFQNSIKKLNYSFERLNYWLWRTILPISVLVLISGQNLVVLVYGEKWTQAGQIFQLMFLFLALIPLSEAYQELLVGSGNISNVVWTRTIQLAIFIPLLLLSAITADLSWVIYAVTFTAFLGWFLMVIHVRKVVDINWGYLIKAPIICSFLATLAGYCTTYLTSGWENLFFVTLLQILSVSSVFLLSLWLFDHRQLLNEWQKVHTHLVSRQG